MKKSALKKQSQIGMPVGTATNRLRKSILFQLLKEAKKNNCFQCGNLIENEEQLSIEHKVPYLDSENPVKLFFDLENIGFSHLKCNVSAARKTVITKHPSMWSYSRGCRCDDCKEIQKLRTRDYRKNKK